jgi:hypothetical protein
MKLFRLNLAKNLLFEVVGVISASNLYLINIINSYKFLGFGVWGLGFGVWGLGFGVWG